MACGHGPVIVLSALDEEELRRTYLMASEAGLPAALFEDENEAGRMSITALGPDLWIRLAAAASRGGFRS